MNTDARWPNRLLPGPKFNIVGLTDAVAEPTDFFEAFGYLFVIAGSKIFRINPSDDSVVLSKDLGTDVAIEGIRWDVDGAIVGAITTAPASKLYRLTAIGSPDTWVTDTATAYRVAAGLDRAFKVDHKGLLKNCLTGLDPTDEDNWSDEVQCGNADEYPTALVAYERTALVGKPEGLFGVSEEGKGIPLISRMSHHANNCLGMYALEPYVLVPHGRGLYRYRPGEVESVGVEREVLNEGLRGGLIAFASDGPWIFAIMAVPATNYYLAVGREVRQGESSLGPYIWDTLAYLTQYSRIIHISSLWDPPRIWAGRQYSAQYARLSKGGGAPDPYGTDYRFITAGIRYTKHYNFGTWQDKDFVKVELAVKDASAAKYWVLGYAINSGSSFSNNDINGTEMRANSDGLWTFYLPVTAKGREIQFRLTYTGDADTSKVEVIHFKPYAVPTALKLRHYNLTLYLANDVRHDIGVERRSSVDQLNALLALTEDAAGVDCKGPWGDITVNPRKIRVLEVRQEGHEAPQFLVEYLVQVRRAS